METEDAIRGRTSAPAFDPERSIDEESVRELVALACRSPSSFNLQHWRFVLVTDGEARAALVDLADGDERFADAPAVVLVLGDLRAHEDLADALEPSIERGDIPADTARDWVKAAGQAFADPRQSRDEAIRSSSMAAMALMLAATDRDLASASTAVFDVDGVRERFELPNRYLPTMLVALGHPAVGKPPRQKVRRNLGEVLAEHDGRELPD